jgi:hypothetical protein
LFALTWIVSGIVSEPTYGMPTVWRQRLPVRAGDRYVAGRTGATLTDYLGIS